MREFAKRRNGTLRKGSLFNFPAGSGCNKRWEITSLGQAPKGLQSSDEHPSDRKLSLQFCRLSRWGWGLLRRRCLLLMCR